MYPGQPLRKQKTLTELVESFFKSNKTRTPKEKKLREDAWIYGSMIVAAGVLAVVLCKFA